MGSKDLEKVLDLFHTMWLCVYCVDKTTVEALIQARRALESILENSNPRLSKYFRLTWEAESLRKEGLIPNLNSQLWCIAERAHSNIYSQITDYIDSFLDTYNDAVESGNNHSRYTKIFKPHVENIIRFQKGRFADISEIAWALASNMTVTVNYITEDGTIPIALTLAVPSNYAGVSRKLNKVYSSLVASLNGSHIPLPEKQDFRPYIPPQAHTIYPGESLDIIH